MSDITDRMRTDWNQRALEDAKYYAAFGRKGQDDEEFFATAQPVVHNNLERELKWVPRNADCSTRRALEIGCGPGRLMFPMSRHFGEIHGVDISDEMVRLAREKLRNVPHAHVHQTRGADLAAFAGDNFDFVYSYAVFQHIPSREVIFSYLHEACRVLKDGGLLRCQFNGLPKTAARYDTWHGARIDPEELIAFARTKDLQLLALEGASTQYMWMTARKRPTGWLARRPLPDPGKPVHIRRITNARSSEPVVPCRGRFASLSLWVEGLLPECDLLDLRAAIRGIEQVALYIGPPEVDGILQQINVALPAPIEPGLAPIQLLWLGKPLSSVTTLRVIPPGPPVPRVLSVSDGVNLLSGTRIVSGYIKVTLEETDKIGDFQAAIDSHPVEDIDTFCVDPLPPRFEINFRVPDAIVPGEHLLEMNLGHRRFAPVPITVAQRD